MEGREFMSGTSSGLCCAMMCWHKTLLLPVSARSLLLGQENRQWMVSSGIAIIKGWRQLPQALPTVAEELTNHALDGQLCVAAFPRPARLRMSPLPSPAPVPVWFHTPNTAPLTSARLTRLLQHRLSPATPQWCAGNPAKYSCRFLSSHLFLKNFLFSA